MNLASQYLRMTGSAAYWAAAAAILSAAAGPVHADQDLLSSDGQWKLHAKVADALAVGRPADVTVDVSPAAGGKGCPAVGSVVFEMPAHGHGGMSDPKVMRMDGCRFRVADLIPSMDGAWRLRLVLKSEGKTGNADFAVTAK